MASYDVTVSSSAAKELEHLPAPMVPKIWKAIRGLTDNPRPGNSRKLKQAEHSYRLRSGEYRVLYTIDDKKKAVMVFAVRHRKEAYR